MPFKGAGVRLVRDAIVKVAFFEIFFKNPSLVILKTAKMTAQFSSSRHLILDIIVGEPGEGIARIGLVDFEQEVAVGGIVDEWSPGEGEG